MAATCAAGDNLVEPLVYDGRRREEDGSIFDAESAWTYFGGARDVSTSGGIFDHE